MITWTEKRKDYQLSAGFSLIELIIIISIIGILSAIIVPRANNLVDSMQLKTAGDKLIDDLRYAHNYAISTHDTTWFVVNIVDNSYGIYVGSSPSDRELIWDPSTNRQALVDFDVQYSGVRITSVNFGGESEVSFDWWGTPSDGGVVVLNGTKSIVIVPETGYVYEAQ